MRKTSIALRLVRSLLVPAALLCVHVAASAQYEIDKQVSEHKKNAKQYMMSREPEKAAAELKAVIELDPADFEAHGNLGFLYYMQNDCANAVIELRRAAEIQPAMWREQAMLGICEDRLGDQEKARPDLEAAFPHLDDTMLARQAGLTLLHLYSHKEDLPKSAAVLAELSEKNPKDPQLNYSAYQLYTALLGEAVTRLSVNNPDSMELHRVMAHEAIRYGDRISAVAHMRAAIKLNPTMPGLHVELANMLISGGPGGDKAEAEKEYRLALDANPREVIALYRLGDLAAGRGDTEVALGYYTKAVQLSPDEPQANIGLAKIYLSKQQPEKAVALLENAIKRDPTNEIAHFRLSEAYRQLGRADEMKQQFDEFQKYKALKDQQRKLYGGLNLHRDEPDEIDADAEKK